MMYRITAAAVAADSIDTAERKDFVTLAHSYVCDMKVRIPYRDSRMLIISMLTSFLNIYNNAGCVYTIQKWQANYICISIDIFFCIDQLQIRIISNWKWK